MRGLHRKHILSAAAIAASCMGVALAAIAGSVATSGANGAAGASVTGATTFSVTISGSEPGASPAETRFFRGFHVYPRAGYQLNVDGWTGPAGWTLRKARGGGVAFGTDAANGDGTYTFTANTDVSAPEASTNELLDVVLTTTGEGKRQPGDQISSDSAKRLPCSIKSLTGTDAVGGYWSEGYSVPRGATSTFTVHFSGSNGPYQVYRATESNEDWGDALGLGIEFPTAPVPASWGLAFKGLMGTLVDGEAWITVRVPDDPALAGKEFFLCAVLKDGNGDIVSRANDIKVTIR